MRGARGLLRDFCDFFTISQHGKREERGQGYGGAYGVWRRQECPGRIHSFILASLVCAS